MQFLRADTAVKVVVGPFVDVGDGFTPETGIGNTPTNLTGVDEAELLKHDNATTVDITSNTWAALTNVDGYYHLSLTASNTDTEGMMTVVIQDDSVCLPVKQEYMVLSAGVYDAWFKQGPIVASAVNDAGATSTDFDTDLTEASDDHYNGRTLIFTSGNLIEQATKIEDYTGSSKNIVVTQLTEAPANNDTFIIV